MKKLFACIVLLLLLPACVRRGDKKKRTHDKVARIVNGEKDSVGTYDKDIEAFEITDDADYDLFDDVVAEDAKQDDSWAWEEMDHEEPTEPIYFDFDSVRIKEDQRSQVRHDAELAKLACEDGATIVIEGHSCLIARSQTYNQAISQRRAEAVKKAFKDLGVKEPCMKAVGRGTTNLVTRDEDRAAQAVNRRTTIGFKYSA
jgi:outer membrane protein OmpA-like peptidoglycan-associated protein